MTIPYCGNCKFVKKDCYGPYYDKCSNILCQESEHYATGDFILCRSARLPFTPCGPQGKLFEEAPKSLPPPQTEKWWEFWK